MSKEKKNAGRKRSKTKLLIGGLLFVAVYEAVLAYIAQRLLEKDMADQ